VRPIVIDTDLAPDDVLAIMVLLRQPAVDVRAITVSGTGEVRCGPGLRNTRRLLTAFGRPEIPVACGRENPGAAGRWFPSAWRDGADAFFGVPLPAVEGEAARGDEAAADMLARIASEAKAAGDPITLVPLGPWTNLADAAALDPAFAGNLAGIHAMGGTIDAPGNVDYEGTTPADMTEWNFAVDPDALAAVLALDVPVTMVGLDATDDVPVPADIESILGEDATAAGADIAHEIYLRNPFLVEGTSFWDTLAAVLLLDPSIATWEDVPVRVVTAGPGAGRTARDPGGRVVRAAMTADRARFMDAFLAGLRTGAPRPERPPVAGAITVTWDGTTCDVTETPAGPAGEVRMRLHNQSGTPVGLIVAGVDAPHTWADALAWASTVDLGKPDLAVPTWLHPVEAAPFADAGQSRASVTTLEPGSYGVACGTGEWPAIELVDGGPFSLGG
jgi:inosine-uridine nucleoside N-ribohydrolase